MHYSKEKFQQLMEPFFDVYDWLAIYDCVIQNDADALLVAVEVFIYHDLQEDAIQILQSLAAEKNAQAQYLLGNCYIEGYGVEEDEPTALSLYKQAAQSGHADAANNLADMYLNGEGTEVDEVQAYKWFTVAAEAGVAEAKFTLGMMHEQGLGVKIDKAKAFDYYNQSANDGYVEAQYYVGMVYLQGELGQAKNIQRAIELFELAEDAQHIDAIFNLGYIYEHGLVGRINASKAIHYYKKAAFMGDTASKQRLVSIYEEGKLVAQDMQQAKKWKGSFIME